MIGIHAGDGGDDPDGDVSGVVVTGGGDGDILPVAGDNGGGGDNLPAADDNLPDLGVMLPLSPHCKQSQYGVRNTHLESTLSVRNRGIERNRDESSEEGKIILRSLETDLVFRNSPSPSSSGDVPKFCSNEVNVFTLGSAL